MMDLMRHKLLQRAIGLSSILLGCAIFMFSGAIMLEIATTDFKDPPAFLDYGLLLFPMTSSDSIRAGVDEEQEPLGRMAWPPPPVTTPIVAD
jgi:hypothetical protein